MENFDWGLQIWTLITFGLVLVLLSKFVFKPLRRILNEREETIRDSLDKAAKTHEEAHVLLQENEKKLNEARETTRQIINEGHKIVADMKREATERARSDADAIVAQAKVEIDRELQKSLDDLKGTVANISLNISRQFIGENLDEKRHIKLADDFIEKLKKINVAKKQTD